MRHRCGKCGRFARQIREAIGLPLSTGFPPDKPMTASTTPYAPFVCSNHRESNVKLDIVEYHPINFQFCQEK